MELVILTHQKQRENKRLMTELEKEKTLKMGQALVYPSLLTHSI